MNRVKTARHLVWELIILLLFIMVASSVHTPILDNRNEGLTNEEEKSCTNSNQCNNGKCIIAQNPGSPFNGEKECPNCVGTCSQYALDPCNTYIELNDQKIVGHVGTC